MNSYIYTWYIFLGANSLLPSHIVGSVHSPSQVEEDHYLIKGICVSTHPYKIFVAVFKMQTSIVERRNMHITFKENPPFQFTLPYLVVCLCLKGDAFMFNEIPHHSP